MRVIFKEKSNFYPELVTPSLATPDTIPADPLLLTRALQNLVRNAARIARRKVQIHGLAQVNKFILAFDDDGIGIPPGKRDRIFEPFTRLDASRSRALATSVWHWQS